jgi:hypothetical protein
MLLRSTVLIVLNGTFSRRRRLKLVCSVKTTWSFLVCYKIFGSTHFFHIWGIRQLFLRNVGNHSPDCTLLQSTRPQSTCATFTTHQTARCYSPQHHNLHAQRLQLTRLHAVTVHKTTIYMRNVYNLPDCTLLQSTRPQSTCATFTTHQTDAVTVHKTTIYMRKT